MKRELPSPIPCELAPVQRRELLQALCAAVAPLHQPPTRLERLTTAVRMLVLALLLGSGGWLYWLLPPGWTGFGVLLVAGVAYALLLIASHEMVHGTLLGWPRLEYGLGCLLGWPMAWPFATYVRVHRLHHRWNGIDERDPERTEALEEERRQAGGLRRWLQRHPLAGRILLLGGLGLIAETAWQGWRLRSIDQDLDRARRLDGLGVTLLHAAMLSLALAQGVLVRYLLFWLVLERVIGAIVQARGLVEHHGLREVSITGGSRLPPVLTQLYASRNVQAGAWLNALMGGLPHHSAHHAFPALASARLPEASRRIEAVLERHGWPAPPRLRSYAAGLVQLHRQAALH